MSFITLQSIGANDEGIATGEANNFVNHFNDPVIINPGDTIELVSCSITRNGQFNITKRNNEFVFRRGYGLGDEADKDSIKEISTRFAQHLVKIPPNVYTGQELAAEMEQQLDENTLLYSYQNTWSVIFTPEVITPPALAFFTFTLGPAGGPVPETLGGRAIPSREEQLYEELDPTGFGQPDGRVILFNRAYTDPFIPTDLFDGRSPNASKLNLSVGLETVGYIHPTLGEHAISVKPVSVVETFDLPGPVGRPGGRVLTFELADLGTIDDLSTPGSLTIISDGGPSTYVNGESVYLEFANADFLRPQYNAGISPYGVDYPLATAVVDPGTLLLTGLTLNIPVKGYKASDIFKVLKASAPAIPAIVQANFIERIYGTGYVDGTSGINAITQVALGAHPTAHGAQVDFTTDALSGGLLTATISVAQSDVMSSTSAIFTVGDIFLRPGGDDNGFIRVASVTAAPAGGTKLVLNNWNPPNETVIDPQEIVPPLVTGWTHEFIIDGVTWYLKVHEDAALVMTKDATNSVFDGFGNEWFKAIADPVEAAAGTPFDTKCTWKKEYEDDDRPPFGLEITIKATTDEGLTQTAADLTFLNTYPKIQLGYSKYQMQRNASETNNPEERYSSQKSDLAVTFEGTANPSGVGGGVLRVSCDQQWAADNDTAFPQDNWSRTNKIIDNEPVLFTTPLGFIYGESEIFIKLSMINNYSPQLAITYETVGSAKDDYKIIVTDNPADAEPKVPAGFKSNLREYYYPLKAIYFYGEAYPFNVTELATIHPFLSRFGQSRITYTAIGYQDDDSSWRESNRRNVLWTLPYRGNDDTNNWDDDALQDLALGYISANQPILMKFDKFNENIQEPGGGALPPTKASGNISWFDSSPGGQEYDENLVFSEDYPNINNGIAEMIGMAPFYQEPSPAAGVNVLSTLEPKSAPRGTIQIEIPQLNIKSWSGGSNDVGRAVGVVPAQEWDVTPGLTADTLFYKSNYPKTINVNSQVTIPAYSLNCRVRDTNGKLINNLQHPTTATFLLKEGEEAKQQRIMDKAMARAAASKGNNQDNRISTANADMPRY